MKQDRISDALLKTTETSGPRFGQALLWQPRFVRDDRILWHVPFLFWLVEAIRPRKYLQLGIGEGVAYMGVCQAVHRARARTECLAVGDWPTDDDVPEGLSTRNCDLYEDFSRLLTGGFQDSSESIADGSVDLMLADLAQAPRLAASLNEQWIPKLSERGILLLNGVDREEETTALLVQMLSERSPTVHLPGGDGLLVVLPQGQLEDELASVAPLAPDDPAHNLIVQMFTRLGAGTYLEAHVGNSTARAGKVEEQLRRISEERDALAAKLEERNRQYDARHRKVAVLQSRCFDLELALQGVEDLEKQKASLEEQLATESRLRGEAVAAAEQEAAARAEAEQARGAAIAAAEQESAARAEAEQARDAAVAAADKSQGARAEAEAALTTALEKAEHDAERLASAEAARAAAESEADREKRQREKAEEAVLASVSAAEREAAARTEAEEARLEALAVAEEQSAARRDAEEAEHKLAAELETLSAKMSALTADADKHYWAIKAMTDALEQGDNLVSALSDELRALKQQIAQPAVQPADEVAAAEPPGLLRRLTGRNRSA